MIASSILLGVTVILTIIYIWCRRTYSYWKRHGIPFVKPTVFLGNTKEAFSLKTSFGLHLSQLYNRPDMRDEAVVGIYTFNQPGLIIRDTELIKSVLIKDFNLFINRYGQCDPHGDVLGNNNLFFARNNYWKELRTKISPVFTSGKVKQMYPLMLEVSSDRYRLITDIFIMYLYSFTSHTNWRINTYINIFFSVAVPISLRYCYIGEII